jgi:hypothetical protein
METAAKRTVRLGITVGLSLGAIVGVVGCGEMVDDDVEGSHEFGISSTNGLQSINGLVSTNGLGSVNGLLSTNGLTSTNGLMSSNGLSSINGLGSVNGLSSTNGLMTTSGGRSTIAYLVKCALASGDSLVKQDQYGASFTFNGGMGLCPAWKTGSIHSSAFKTCQNMLSACLMAHVNTAGVHIPIWMDSENRIDGKGASIGWGVDPTNYPAQEGTFFGNIIETGDLAGIGMAGVVGPKAYYCEGMGFSNGTVQGRLGAGQAGANLPYTNPFGGKCTGSASSENLNGVPHGYKQACANNYCFQNGEPITIWRNPGAAAANSVQFNSAYTYRLSPRHLVGKSVDVAYAATTNGTAVIQYGSWSGDPQKFAILASGSNWKIAMKINTAKCLHPVNNGTANGTQIEIRDCNGSANQAWAATLVAGTSDQFTFKNVASNRCLDVPGASTADSARMNLWDCNGQNQQKFAVNVQ